MSTYFDHGRKDSSSDVFLIGGGVASRSNGGGELTCKSSLNLPFDSRTQNGIFSFNKLSSYRKTILPLCVGYPISENADI